MIRRLNVWISLGVIVAAGLWTSSASAQVIFGGPGGYGLGFFNYNQNEPRIPYYALYPPVYYSYPVARPYGFSPFAYPPGVATPDVAPPPAAANYRNPYVIPKGDAKPAADKTTSRARMYSNPYVAGYDAGTASLAKRED